MAASGLGDELRLECESQGVRPSKSRIDHGVIKLWTTTLNQNNKPVQIQTAIFSFPGEPPRTTEKSKVSNWAGGIAQILEDSGKLSRLRLVRFARALRATKAELFPTRHHLRRR
jgi:hypothetical protein